MFRLKIRSVEFSEHPATDSASAKANVLDVLLNLNGPLGSAYSPTVEEYCLAVLHKICTLPSDQIRLFLGYQQQLLFNPSAWLTSLDELIISNAEVFENKNLLLKAEKTLLLIELAQQDLKLNKNASVRIFDFEEVRNKLKTITSFDDQLIYLYDLKAEYLQNTPRNSNPDEISFDQKVRIEIEKIHELQSEFDKIKNQRNHNNRPLAAYIDNEDFIIMMKISKRTAQTWRNNGIIAYSHICNKIYYKLSDVEALLSGNYIRSFKRP